MRAVRLLEELIRRKPKRVLDIGVRNGRHAECMIANGIEVVGLDVSDAPFQHPMYSHIPCAFELAQFGDEKFDAIWCSHTLEHLPNPQMALIKMRELLNADAFLAIAVPTDRQRRFHCGHLSLWTPALLAYNLICAGWDCKEAIWYTEYMTIGMVVPFNEEIDLSWRTGMPSEIIALNQYTPIPVRHHDGAWWGDRWPESDMDARPIDPPSVTIGHEITNLDPEVFAPFGPNPSFRKPHGRSKTG